MRHRKHSNQLGVTKEHRSALLANLASSLIQSGRIRTTLKKTKALRPFIEKIITLAKKGDLHSRRIAMARLRNLTALGILFDEKASEFANRNGGYTRIYKLSDRRIGDAAEMALIEFVGADDEGYRKSRRGKGKATTKAKSKAPVAKEEVVEEVEVVEAETTEETEDNASEK
jgi:large subunit ribosomal protein L17